MKTLRNISLFAVLLLSPTTFWAQNLVPNPSFEEYTGCPQGYPDLDGKCLHWQSFRITPDYMNNCSPYVGSNNQFGYQAPHSGEAYVGLCTYQVTGPGAREHIGVQLTSPLTIGTTYYISFFVSSGYTPLLVNIATNKIGALLTTYQYFDPGGTSPLINTSTIYTDSIIVDTTNWTKVSGSFIADSAYEYLIIGNFFNNSFVDTINFPYQVVPQIAYYYVDDVCLSTDSIYTHTWTTLSVNNIENYNTSVFPNPARDFITIQSHNVINNIEIQNFLGQTLVNTYEVSNEKEIKMDVSHLKSGVYFIKIKDIKNENYTQKLIIN